jgi:PKD repeat protein
MFPGRTESGMTIDSGNLVGTIGPEETHVYLLDMAVAANTSPTASIDADPDDLAFGETRDFDASASGDSDGTIASYEWDFGDGATATGALASHAYATTGTYWTRLTVRDDDGATATAFASTEVTLTSQCAPSPRLDCTSGTGGLRMSMPSASSKRALKWKWRDGAIGSFGTPTSTTEIAVCIYAGGSRVLATSARPSAQQWVDRGEAGLRFKDTDTSPGGLSTMKLVADPSDARIQVKGKGSSLPALAFPLATPVVIQLVGSDVGECAETSFDTADVDDNDASRFSASH